MRYLVTGGAGFIGSHLVDRLVAQGGEVTVLDNLSTGDVRNLEVSRDRIELAHGSVLDPVLVDELASESDVIVHLAAAVGVNLIVEKPLRSFITNIKGAENVLEAAHRYRSKVMMVSTSEIYGKNANGPFSEDDDRVIGSTKIARWGYSTSKAVDEILSFAYHREKGLPVVVVRLFNTVGPRQTGTHGMVIPSFVDQALQGNPLTVFGDGQQTRCFCHVDDVVSALLGLIAEPKAEGEVFNVGSSEEVTILELAERIIKQTGSKSTINKISYDEAFAGGGYEDMRNRVPDITRVGSLIGWKPTRSLDEIIASVIEFARTPR